MSIGQTIISQINEIDFWARARWGVTGGTGRRPIKIENGVKFKTCGIVKWKGWVSITLNGMDTYDISFFRIRAGEIRVDKVVNNVYNDQLVTIIDEQVG